MKRKVARLRLSPNEEARIIREEHERRRKLRIQQVREQQRYISLQICRDVEQRRRRELELLENQLRAEWEKQQREKLDALQQLYQESLQLLGQGHRSAREHEPDFAAIAQREAENHAKAAERHREALKELKTQKSKDHENKSRLINARKRALQAEKERAEKVAALPPPPPNPIQNIDSNKPHVVVKKSNVKAFAATHFHLPESSVDREADTQQPNACVEAELEAKRLEDLQKEEQMRRQEQLEKARLRGKQALNREHLTQDRERLLVELEHMQQTDLLRRRQQLPNMPAQIFQPLYQRQEMRRDFQREMEFAFEDMYTGERRVKGDLVVQLMPEPLPAASTGSEDQELDITMEETESAEQEDTSTEHHTAAQVVPSKLAPRKALRKLLDRIRSQRTEWSDSNGSVSAAEAQNVITDLNDQIPVRDTTIDTGSLTSQEKDWVEPPMETPVLERTEPAASLPHVLPDRIKDFEEERKEREVELERQKQQQLVLLQELEEQKEKLEQMLFEAQQEREDLKNAVTRDDSIDQSEDPVHDQDVPYVTTLTAPTSEPVHPADGDDHTRRIREYQQRLLEQNRVHQRTVEVARQRLDEYQRALRIRYNMTATSFQQPAIVPTSHIHRPQFSTQPLTVTPPVITQAPLHLPTPLILPPTPTLPTNIQTRPQISVDIPTRDFNTVPSPPHQPGSSFRVMPWLLPDKAESFPNIATIQRPGVTAQLTDDIMERVTEHLPESVRPSTLTTEPSPNKLFTTRPSASVPIQTGAATPLVPGHPATGTLLQSPVQTTSPLQTSAPGPSEDTMAAQRLELAAAQRRLAEQREAVKLQQDEDRRRQEQNTEQIRRQKETLQALIQPEAQPQPVPEAQSDISPPESINQTRLTLLKSLLRAIEETNGGTLSHLQETEDEDGSPQEASVLSDSSENDSICQFSVPAPVSVLPSKPPVTRVRPEIMMNVQHELSAIQEVETPADTSQATGPEETVLVPSLTADWDLREDSESSVATDKTLQTPPSSSRGQQTALLPAGTGAISSDLPWRERLLVGAGSPQGASQSGPEETVLVPSLTADWDLQEDSESSVATEETLQTPPSSSRGQQTAVLPAGTGAISSDLPWRERLLVGAGSPQGASQSDSMLRIISPPSSDSGTGADFSGPRITSFRSYTESADRHPDSDCLSSTTISTGSYVTTDPEQNADQSLSPRHGEQQERGSDLLAVPSPSGPRESSSASDCPVVSVERLFNDSSIQRIIDRYTRELNISLSTTGKTTDSDGSSVEDRSSSDSLGSVVPESGGEEGSLDHRSTPSDTAQRRGLELQDTVSPIPEHFSLQDQFSLQDSFRPLIGQLADESSCLSVDHRDTDALRQLVGQPSAHSSMMGQLPAPLASNIGGWDSTLSRMIGQLSSQSSSHWLSGGQDFYAGQLVGHMGLEAGQSTTWLEAGPEESGMRALVGEMYDSAGQDSQSSGEITHVDLGVSTEAESFPPEASSQGPSVPDLNPQPQEQTTGPGLERTEVFPGSDSFHPLFAEVTHNETADASMTFHLPDLTAPLSPEEPPASEEQSSMSAPSEQDSVRTLSDAPDDRSTESELSPERLRTERHSDSNMASSNLQESFSQLITSVELRALSPSSLAVCEDVGLGQSEEAIAEIKFSSESRGVSVQLRDLNTGELESKQDSNLIDDIPVADNISDCASEKGILEQSMITLVSLTDTTLHDRDFITDEDGLWEDGQSDGGMEDGRRETERSESMLLKDETEEEKNQTHPATSLKIVGFGSVGDKQEIYEQKRQALLQRSTRRVEEIKARRLSNIQTEAREMSLARGPAKSTESKPAPCKTKSERQQDATTSKEGPVSEKSDLKLRKTQIPPPVSDLRPKKADEVKDCTPEQRKRDVAEMQQRTRRLYERLEEVKQQKTIKSRQEAYAKNRLKAAEFHKKTLQKLRAKQTQH